MMIYCLGFMYSECGADVLLLRKGPHSKMSGLLNGVGGKVEPNEFPGHAMVRECKEETGIETTMKMWRNFASIIGEGYYIQCYSIKTNAIETAKSASEPLIRMPISQLSFTHGLAPHVSWLVPMGLDPFIVHCTVFPYFPPDPSQPFVS